MGGHSHWSQIKRQKGAADAKRGQVFTKLGREITVAARQGGPDPEANARLRLVILKAREQNMPMDTIERAIKRGAGQLDDGVELIEATYEAYGPGGVAILMEILTDNRNRAVSEIRSTLSRAGATMAENGSVAWVFESKGTITVENDGIDPNELALQAIDAGAEDVQVEDGRVEIVTAPENFEQTRRALSEMGIAPASAEVTMVPKTTVPLTDKEAEAALRLLDRLEDLDDVQRVHSNAEFPDEVLAAYASR
jgi:YebC/PmpR family DNA-binding regulatory protein